MYYYLLSLILALTLTPLPDGRLSVAITTNAPAQLYTEISTEGGTLLQDAPHFLCTLQADESCGRVIAPIPGWSAGSVRVRVWANTGDPPLIDRSIIVPPRADVHRVYLPLI